MRCPRCGTDNSKEQRFCLSCGSELRPENALAPVEKREARVGWAPARVGAEFPGQRRSGEAPKLELPRPLKSEFVAGLLGLLPGVGQMYVGQAAKGATMLVACLVLYIVLGILTWGLTCLCVAPLIPFISAFDAAAVARRINRGELVSPWQFF